MKKITSLLAIMLIVSCSVEPAENNDVFNSYNAKVETSSIVFTPPSQICAGEPADFCFTAEIGTNLQIQQRISGIWEQLDQISQSISNPQCFGLSFETAGNYELRYKTDRGFSEPVWITVNDCSSCEESFSYTGGNNNYTFTYIPAENMTDALVEFTFAQTVAVDGFDESWTSAGQTVQKYMDLSKCETYAWTLELTKDCKGRTPNNNIWTDFKVNSISKKGELENIVQECSN